MPHPSSPPSLPSSPHSVLCDPHSLSDRPTRGPAVSPVCSHVLLLSSLFLLSGSLERLPPPPVLFFCFSRLQCMLGSLSCQGSREGVCSVISVGLFPLVLEWFRVRFPMREHSFHIVKELMSQCEERMNMDAQKHPNESYFLQPWQKREIWVKSFWSLFLF